MPRRPDPDHGPCPCCHDAHGIEGPAHTPEFDAGLYIACPACGFSITGPDHDLVRTAWAACRRSTVLKDLTA